MLNKNFKIGFSFFISGCSIISTSDFSYVIFKFSSLYSRSKLIISLVFGNMISSSGPKVISTDFKLILFLKSIFSNKCPLIFF